MGKTILLKAYKYLNVLSIDVVFGACISSLFLADYLAVSLPFSIIWCLALVVFLIYTSDHLMDAQKIKHAAHTERHFFHQKHFLTMFWICVLTALLGMVSLFWLPDKTFIYGLYLMALVIAYFILLKLSGSKAIFHKELIIALIYTLGIFLGPISVFTGEINFMLIMVFIQFFILAFSNLLLFSCYENEMDKKDGHTSFVKFAGIAITIWVTRLLLIFTQLSAIVLMMVFHDDKGVLRLQFLVLAMAFTLMLLAFNPGYFQKHERYRTWGDAVFLYPLVPLLV